MRNRVLMILCSALAVLLFAQACTKDKDDGDHSDHQDIPSVLEQGELSFLGARYSSDSQGAIPYYIKGGTAYPVNYAGETPVISAIDATRNGVYLAGFTPSRSRALLFKDGEELLELQTPNTRYEDAQSVFADGDDIYVAGSYILASNEKERIGVVWKNGEPIFLTDGTYNTVFTSMYVANGDVYVVGYQTVNKKNISKCWKNGKEILSSSPDVLSYFNRVYVEEQDVYVAGYSDDLSERKLKLWKNGVLSNLSSGDPLIRSTGLAVENGVSYLAGYRQMGKNNEPLLFKGGEEQNLERLEGDGQLRVVGLKVYDGNTIVLGINQGPESAQSILWVNGSRVSLKALQEDIVIEDFDFQPL